MSAVLTTTPTDSDADRGAAPRGGLPPLRFTTCGSVDDGKSTLIGRLLFDTGSIPEDQLRAIRLASEARGQREPDLSLLTDGLRSEREQGITIDVAYRYFGTPRRRFIVADAPGHAQYTRNMATAASVADMAVILIDARHGITAQTRRHTRIAATMRTPSLVVAVNKIDLVPDPERVFRGIEHEYRELLESLGAGPNAARFLPISALRGDNVVRRAANPGWYDGPTLLDILETTRASVPPHASNPLRAQVQAVIRPDGAAARAYGVTVLSGVLSPGDMVTVLPSGHTTRVEQIWLGESRVPAADAGRSVTIALRDEIDVSRGDLFAASGVEPIVTPRVRADVVWLDRAPLRVGARLLAKHGSRAVRVRVEAVERREDIHHAALAEPTPEGELRENEIGRVRLRAAAPLILDPYDRNRATGSFILIDETTTNTVGGALFIETPGEVA
jgi:sulfate adenylyltransferase subunit 1